MNLSDLDYYLHNTREGTVTCDLLYVLCCALRHPRDLLPPNLLLPRHFSLPLHDTCSDWESNKTKPHLKNKAKQVWVSELPPFPPWITHANKASMCFDCCTVSRLLLEWAELITVGAFCRRGRGGAVSNETHLPPFSLPPHTGILFIEHFLFLAWTGVWFRTLYIILH